MLQSKNVFPPTNFHFALVSKNQDMQKPALIHLLSINYLQLT